MKFLVVLFAFIVALIGFANARICDQNPQDGDMREFNTVEEMEESNRQGSGKYFE